MLVTEQLAQLKAKREELRVDLSELENHGGRHSPVNLVDDETAYYQLPEDELKAEKSRVRTAIAEVDADIARCEGILKRKFSRHQVQTAQARALRTVPKVTAILPHQEAQTFRALSDDYRDIGYKGELIRLGRKAAPAIKVMDTPKGRTQGLRQRYILDTIGSKSKRLSELFKRGDANKLWGTLIVMVRPDIYRLNVE